MERPTGKLRNPLRPIEELALATELLESWERGMIEPFMERLVRAVERAGGGPVPERARRALVPTLAAGASRALPPMGADGALRSARAARAGVLLGLETEGLSPEGTEFELARQLVRRAAGATSAAAEAARMPSQHLRGA